MHIKSMSPERGDAESTFHVDFAAKKNARICLHRAEFSLLSDWQQQHLFMENLQLIIPRDLRRTDASITTWPICFIDIVIKHCLYRRKALIAVTCSPPQPSKPDQKTQSAREPLRFDVFARGAPVGMNADCAQSRDMRKKQAGSTLE